MEYYLEKATSPLSAAECKKIATFITYFHTALPDQTVSALYKALLAQKNGKKPAEELVKDLLLLEKLTSADDVNETLSEIEKKIVALAKEKQTSAAALEIRMKDFYSLTAADIPTVTDTEGKAVPKTVMFFLLTMHETVDSYGYVTEQYEKPGVSPEAAEIVPLLDQASLQNALRELASQNLGMTGHSKKMYLAYPICRYADEALMDELTKQAPKWRSSVSGNEAPPLRTFRDACVYSETRAALLFAEKYKDLDKFASVRGTTADLLRDRVLSDIGLAPDGTKTYTRMTNHIIAYLDRVTVYGRIANDDVSVETVLPSFTLAQITEFIRIATESNAVNVTALLLNYKNETYPDFDPFEEFSLDLLD